MLQRRSNNRTTFVFTVAQTEHQLRVNTDLWTQVTCTICASHSPAPDPFTVGGKTKHWNQIVLLLLHGKQNRMEGLFKRTTRWKRLNATTKQQLTFANFWNRETAGKTQAPNTVDRENISAIMFLIHNLKPIRTCNVKKIR